MEMYYLSRKHLNQKLFPSPHYYLSSLLFALSSKSLPPLCSTPQTQILSSHQLHTIPTPHSSTPFISSSVSSPFPSTRYPFSRFLNKPDFSWFRGFSASSRTNASGKQVSEIINLIRSGSNDLESKLDAMNIRLSEVLLNTIFRILNREKIPALRFFNWIRKSHPEFRHDSDIYSLVVDNCGRSDDFDSIFNLLNDFRIHGICLNQKAFSYLPVMISNQAAMKESICKTMEILNKIGGSCGVTGTHALIEMLCALGSFEMAEYVITKTVKRLSNYGILIRSRSRKGHFEEAKRVLDEMTGTGITPNCEIFNYILGCLQKTDQTDKACQLLEFMVENGCPPNALTYEIFICNLCRHGKLDMAFDWLNKMESKGIEPRPTTHAALIKGYFKLQQYEQAHQYVVVCSDKYKTVSNMIYSLLASLYRKQGKPVMAQSVLSEMIEKGLSPNFTVYMHVRKHLQKIGREDLARNLESSFSCFISQPSAVNG
ncbi:hypothetical protein E1A91_D07G099100v1 [Gossypium mustelinum]|uniref:Pentacotripeptide-repeat region of PRORP domain-containing protein n=1 Tax=Gossypium mustelinum TaxID=34275 RepID=A0A5D2U621_GOSMU|nr:hypothetical protein E1A91_D07G099100v1 [Gossypium mustelinum]